MTEIGSESWKALLSYMHLEDLEADSTDARLVQSMHTAAVRYLAEAGVTAEKLQYSDKPEEDLALYELALQSMTLDMYDRRGSAASAAVGVRDWINQLKGTCMEGYL